MYSVYNMSIHCIHVYIDIFLMCVCVCVCVCREFTRRVSLQKSGQGQILVDSHLRAVGDTTGRVYALGDCAQVEGHTLPCTGVCVCVCV